MRRLLIAAALLALSPEMAFAGADEPRWEESDELPAVQNRKYRLEHELGVGVGMLPTDPYTKGVALAGSYAWHLSDLWAVEGRFNWLFNYSTSLRDKLEGNFGVVPTRFDTFTMFGQLGGLFKPLYGKLAFLNDSQVYGELYVSLYGVVAQMEGGRKTDEEPQGKGQRLAFGGAPGFGVRGFLNRYMSVRFDINWMVLVSQSGEAHTPLQLSLNLAFTTRSDP